MLMLIGGYPFLEKNTSILSPGPNSFPDDYILPDLVSSLQIGSSRFTKPFTNWEETNALQTRLSQDHLLLAKVC